jgi:hypothetical protein
LLLDSEPIQSWRNDDQLTIAIFLHLNFSGRFGMQNTNPNEGNVLPLLWRLSLDESIYIHFLCINFKRTITVDCGEEIPLKEDLPLHNLDGETPSFVNTGKV